MREREKKKPHSRGSRVWGDATLPSDSHSPPHLETVSPVPDSAVDGEGSADAAKATRARAAKRATRRGRPIGESVIVLQRVRAPLPGFRVVRVCVGFKQTRACGVERADEAWSRVSRVCFFFFFFCCCARGRERFFGERSGEKQRLLSNFLFVLSHGRRRFASLDTPNTQRTLRVLTASTSAHTYTRKNMTTHAPVATAAVNGGTTAAAAAAKTADPRFTAPPPLTPSRAPSASTGPGSGGSGGATTTREAALLGLLVRGREGEKARRRMRGPPGR